MNAGDSHHFVPWSDESGQGDDLVLLVHGSMDRSAGLLKLGRRLVDETRVIRYDRRGYGRSVPCAGPFGMPQQVDDAEAVLAGRRAVVFGHSYGGNVALALAARRPDLVRAVLVYEPPLSWLDWWPGTTAGSNALATRGDPGDAAERFMRRLVGDAKWERLPPSTRDARRSEGAAMVGELSDLRERQPWDPEAIGCPVVALHGERGAPHHRAAVEHLTGLFPGSRLLRIDDAGHAGPNTHPTEVATVVSGVLAATDDDQHAGGGGSAERQAE